MATLADYLHSENKPANPLQPAQDAYNAVLRANGYTGDNGGIMGSAWWNQPQIVAAHNAYQDALRNSRNEVNGVVPPLPYYTPTSGQPTAYAPLKGEAIPYGDPTEKGGFMDIVRDTMSNPIPLIAATLIGGEGAIGAGAADAGIAGATDAGFTPFSLSGAATSAGNGLGSLFGDATLGTDIGNGISGVGNSFSSLFSGAGDNGSPLGLGDSTSAARSAISDASTAGAAPTNTLGGYLPTGGSAAGGGTSSGFFSAPTDATTFGATPVDTSSLDSLGSVNAPASLADATITPQESNFLSNATDAANSTNASGSVIPSTPIAKGSSMFQPSSLANLALKTGLSYGLGKTNDGGYGAVQGAQNQSAANYQPFLNTGQAATTSLGNLYGLNGAGAQQAAQQNWQNTPGYQFSLGQGLNALDASAASRGMLMSGNQQQAVQKYGTGLADQTYQNYLANLQNAAGQGVTAAGGVGTGQVGAAQAYSQNKANQATNFNQMLGSLGNYLFPANGSSIFG